ncbi:MAG: carboxypeptidase-like regulatory domain-containing protein, partial [Planctomycetota bacterium]
TDPEPLTGSLALTVLWSNGQPAQDVRVLVTLPGHAHMRNNRRLGHSDAAGHLRFDDLPVGTVDLACDRSQAHKDHAVPIEAGQTTEFTYTLEPGVDVLGVVRNSKGVPVAGAGIWLTQRLSGWTGGRILTRCDSGGQFSLRSLPPGQSLGVLASGYLPSVLIDLDTLDLAESPVNVTFVLNSGGADLTGRVIDNEGKPVPGAQVVLGNNDRSANFRSDGSIEEIWSPRLEICDAQGRFAFEGVEPGPDSLRARAPGFGITLHEVDVQLPGPNEVELVLQPGCTVSGIVTGPGGEPMAGATLHATEIPFDLTFLQSGQVDYAGSLPHPITTSDAEGRYRLTSVHAGEVFLYAQEPYDTRTEPAAVRFARHFLTLTPGSEVQWNPRIDDGPSISGFVVYRDGTAVTNVFLDATPSEGSEKDNRALHTTDGHFKFIGLNAEPYDVRVQIWNAPQDLPPPVVRSVLPGGPPLRIEVAMDNPEAAAPAIVRVRFEDTGQRAADPERVTMTLRKMGQWITMHAPLEAGLATFEVETKGDWLPVALYQERVIAVGTAVHVEPGAEVDLGILRSIPGGTLDVTFAVPAGLELQGAHWYLTSDESRSMEEGAYAGAPSMRLETWSPAR